MTVYSKFVQEMFAFYSRVLLRAVLSSNRKGRLKVKSIERDTTVIEWHCALFLFSSKNNTRFDKFLPRRFRFDYFDGKTINLAPLVNKPYTDVN